MSGTPPEDSLQKAKNQALRLLAVRERSCSEMRERLEQKGHSPELVEKVIEKLCNSELLDDWRFAQVRASSMGRNKGWGPRKLKVDLLRRGIEADIVAEAVAVAYGEERIEEVMRRLVVKRFGEEVLSGQAGPKEVNKAWRFLLGRGFESEQVELVLGWSREI